MAFYLNAARGILASRDDDFVETGGEQDEGLEVPATHGPPLLGKQTRIGTVLHLGNNGTLLVLNVSVGGACSRDEDAPLVTSNTSGSAPWLPGKLCNSIMVEVMQRTMENGRNGEGMVGWPGEGLLRSTRTRILLDAVGTRAIQGLAPVAQQAASGALTPILALVPGKRAQFSGASSISAGRILRQHHSHSTAPLGWAIGRPCFCCSTCLLIRVQGGESAQICPNEKTHKPLGLTVRSIASRSPANPTRDFPANP